MTLAHSALPAATLQGFMPIVDANAPMSPETYRWAIDRFGLSIGEAGRFFGVSEKNARKMAIDGPSPPVAKLVLFMLARDYTPEEVN